MKQVAFLTILLFLVTALNAQISVNIKGQIINTNNSKLLFIRNDEGLIPIKSVSDGTFILDLKCYHLPSFITLNGVSKRGKIIQYFPKIWFASDSVKIIFDFENKSFQTHDRTNFQDLSEKIEALGKKKRLKFLIENFNKIPSLYFIEYEKHNFALNDLRRIYQGVQSQYGNLIYVQRLGGYIEAKSKPRVKIGSKVEDFKLPNKSGDYQSVLTNTSKQKLIAILSSGCQYSIASIPLLEQFYKISKEQNKNIELITIWSDESYQSDSTDKIIWLDLLDEYGFASTYFNRNMWPAFYVISNEHVLIDKFSGYGKKTAKRLERLLQ